MKKSISCMKLLFGVILTLLPLIWSQGAQAQEYPMRPITMLISVAPGAGVDVCGRMIAQGATKILGQEIIPVNKPGGIVAAGLLANSKGDGYTLLAFTSSSLTVTPHMESVIYDPLKDIIPIIQFGSLISGIVVRSDSPYNSLKDLVEFARKNPGKVSYGIPSIGVTPHLIMEYLKTEENVDITIIPFGGSTPTITALLGGHISACAVSTSGFLSLAPRIGYKFGVQVITDYIQLVIEPESNNLLCSKPVYGGKVVSTFKLEKKPYIVTLRCGRARRAECYRWSDHSFLT